MKKNEEMRGIRACVVDRVCLSIRNPSQRIHQRPIKQQKPAQ